MALRCHGQSCRRKFHHRKRHICFQTIPALQRALPISLVQDLLRGARQTKHQAFLHGGIQKFPSPSCAHSKHPRRRINTTCLYFTSSISSQFSPTFASATNTTPFESSSDTTDSIIFFIFGTIVDAI